MSTSVVLMQNLLISLKARSRRFSEFGSSSRLSFKFAAETNTSRTEGLTQMKEQFAYRYASPVACSSKFLCNLFASELTS